MPDRTTYTKAVLGYDEEHEKALLAAVTTAIFKASMVSDCNAAVIRTGECAQALLTALACILALSPAASRSPASIRSTIDNLHKRFRRKVASAGQDAELQEFLRRSFHRIDEEGSA
jgi:hypothetical protein